MCVWDDPILCMTTLNINLQTFIVATKVRFRTGSRQRQPAPDVNVINVCFCERMLCILCIL